MKNIKSIIENSDTYWGRKFDLFIQFLIFISLVTFTLETLPNIPPKASYWLRILEVATVYIFTLKYLLRIFVADNKLRFIFSFYGIIDFFAILPFYLTIGVDLRSIRIFRLLRLIRIFKILRFSRAVDRFQKAFFLIKDELWVFATTTLFLLYISSVGIKKKV